MKACLLALAGFVLCCPTAVDAQNTRMLIVGDSWAEEQWIDGSHVRVFNQNGWGYIGVYGNSTTESGSTAFDWKQADYLQLIDSALVSYPNIDTVQLTVGGNDFLNAWHTGMSASDVDQLTNAILFDLNLTIDYILNRNPAIEVLLSLYDYPNFRDTLGGLGGWFACEPRWQDMGQPTPQQLNEAALGLVEAIAGISAQNPRVHFIDHFGLMQYTYGLPDIEIPPGTLLPPGDISEPSPVEAMRRHFLGIVIDCFHLRADGYDVIVENLVTKFLDYRFDGVADVQVTNLNHVYDGNSPVPEVTTYPPGLNVALNYDGEANGPSDAGSYTVVAEVEQTGWTGVDSQTLVIAQAPQSIDFPAPASVINSQLSLELQASASSGLTPDYAVLSGPAVIEGNWLILTGDVGIVVVEAVQPGDNNWLAAIPVQQQIEVIPNQLFRDRFANGSGWYRLP